MNTILLTGYDKWHDKTYNSSWDMLESATIELPPHWTLAMQKLPVSWEKASAILEKRINPNVKAIVCLGMCGGNKIRCERIALNLINPALEDVDRKTRDSEFVIKDGPAAYWTRLPFREIGSALQNQGIPAVEYHNAGGYLCNYIFYWVLDYIAQKQLDTVAGFIHVPPFEDLGGIERGKLSTAANIIANTVVDFVENKQ